MDAGYLYSPTEIEFMVMKIYGWTIESVTDSVSGGMEGMTLIMDNEEPFEFQSDAASAIRLPGTSTNQTSAKICPPWMLQQVNKQLLNSNEVFPGYEKVPEWRPDLFLHSNWINRPKNVQILLAMDQP